MTKSLFELGSLLIWFPGLLFFVTLIYWRIAVARGIATRLMKLLTLGFYVIAVFMAFLIPQLEMAKAVSFANAHESNAGAGITRYAEIESDAKDAYFRTALPAEEQGEEITSGADLFSFDDSADATAPVAEQSDTALAGAAPAEGGEGVVYQPQKPVAWGALMFFLLVGSALFLQGAREIFPPRR